MARLLTCGWETGSISELPGARRNVAIRDDRFRTGRYSMVAMVGPAYQQVDFDTAEPKHYGRVAFYMFATNLLLADPALLEFYDTDGNKSGSLKVNRTTKKLYYVGPAGTTLRTGNQVLTMEAWYVLEWYMSVGTRDGTCAWRINGVTDGAYNGDTQGSYTTALGAFRICSGAQPLPELIYFDDMAVNNDDGDFQDAWVGQGKVELLIPIADATYEWTPSTGADHYALVDDLPRNTTDWVQSGTAGTVLDTFVFTDSPSYIQTPDVVQVVYYAAAAGSGVAACADVVMQDSVYYVGGSATVYTQADTYTLMRGSVHYEQPNGSGVWTATAINDLVAGVVA